MGKIFIFIFVLLSLITSLSFATTYCGIQITPSTDLDALLTQMEPAAALETKAIASYKVGDYLSAAQYLEIAYASCPDESFKLKLYDCYDKLGWGYLAKEDYNNSIIYYQKYLEGYPNDFAALYNMGTCYDNLKNYDMALSFYQKAYDSTWDATKIKTVNDRIAELKNRSSITTSQDTTNTTSNTNDELSNAILWMYNNGLTKFNEPTSFMSENGLRRDEATKFFVQYSKEVMGMTPDTSKTSCNFTDLNQARPDLKDLIKESCQLGLFQGSNGKFMPTQQLTNAQTITVFVRLIDGYKDETGGHFANEYYTVAKNLGLLDDMNLNNKSLFDSFTTRGEVGKMLFRGKNK